MRAQLSLFAAGLLILASLLLVTGCGGDDSSSNDSVSDGTTASGTEATNGDSGSLDGSETDGGSDAEPPSAEKKEFIAEADAICRPTGKRILKEVEQLVPPGGIEEAEPEEFDEYVGRALAPGLDEEIDEIRELEIPEEDTDEVEEILSSLESDVARAVDNPAGFFQEGNPFTATQQLALDYGFEVCGGLVPRPNL